VEQETMLWKSIVFATSIIAGQASAQEAYVFGGLGVTQGDYEYAYLPDSETTDFEFDGVSAYLGYGKVFATYGRMAIAGEADIAFGDMESDLIEGGTTPCLVGEGGCTGKVSALATFRVVAGANSGTLRPFASLGLAVGKVEGTADLGACGFIGECSYDESLFGLAAGIGATYDVNDAWKLRGEVLYTDLGQPEFSSPDLVRSDDIQLTQFRLGVQFRY
jgi:outer membrane immunogenic protein